VARDARQTRVSDTRFEKRKEGRRVSKKYGNQKKERTTHDASSETASHQSEADKQKESSPPDRPRIAEPVLPADPVLVDQADDEHSEERADPWNPVDERYVYQYRFGLVGRLSVRGEDRGVEESPVGDGELQTTSVRYPRERGRMAHMQFHRIIVVRSVPMRMRRERTKERNAISLGFGNHLRIGGERTNAPAR